MGDFVQQLALAIHGLDLIGARELVGAQNFNAAFSGRLDEIDAIDFGEATRADHFGAMNLELAHHCDVVLPLHELGAFRSAQVRPGLLPARETCRRLC